MDCSSLSGCTYKLADHGVIYDDRTAAVANAAIINELADCARVNSASIDFGCGTIFFDGTLNLSAIHCFGHGIGIWMMQPAQQSASVKKKAMTQLVAVSSSNWPATKVYGVSSCKTIGAGRELGCQRDGTAWSGTFKGRHERYWEMMSFAQSGSTGVGVAKSLKVAILIDQGNSVIENMRIFPDGGGVDGMAAYTDRFHGTLIGDMDIGVLQISGYGCSYRNVQIVGHWRMFGYCNMATLPEDSNDYTPPYETHLNECMFEGMRSYGLRGPDRWPIIASTSSTVDLPWADDHPFTLDTGRNIFIQVNRGTGPNSETVTYHYSAVEKVTVDGNDHIRLTVDGTFIPGDDHTYGAIVNCNNGGVDSHIIANNCVFAGLTLPNGYAANDAVNPAGAQVFNGAVGGVEISGWRCAEEEILNSRIQHNGSIAIYKHDGRNGVFDVIMEANPDTVSTDESTENYFGSYFRIIMSPATNMNSHATEKPVGGTRWTEWRTLMQNEYTFPEIDFAPAINFIPRPSAFNHAGDKGWFECFDLIRPSIIRTRYDGEGGEFFFNHLTAPQIAVGPFHAVPGNPTLDVYGAEGWKGFIPAENSLIHARSATGDADLRVQTLESGADPGVVLQNTEGSVRICKESDKNSNFSIISEAAPETLVRHTYSGANPGWHWLKPSYFDASVTCNGGLAITSATGAASANVKSSDSLARQELISYRNSAGTHTSFAGYAAYGTESAPAVPTSGNANLTELNCLVWGGSSFTSRGHISFYSASAHSAGVNAGIFLGLDLTRDGSTDKTRVANFYAGNDASHGGMRIAGDVYPWDDNKYLLGTASARWSTVYAATGTINTSDEREKRDIAPIEDDLLDAWGDVEWLSYRFKSAVDAKGSDARRHVGLVAQRVKRAIDGRIGEGTAVRFGLLCHDEWPAVDEEIDGEGAVISPARPAGDRWALRYDECFALEMAWQRRKIAKLEQLLTQ